MKGNKSLGEAKRNKKDEFYTRLEDISREMSHYKPQFAGKTVLCNCDDPRISNFFKYFMLLFGALGLKRLIATCYKNQDADLFSEHKAERAVYMDVTAEDVERLTTLPNGERIPMTIELFPQIEARALKGDGDFRSSECVALLEQADIVVTNPPFSLFREYVAQLVQHEKQFLIIGSVNAITYKEIFPLLKENKMWLGYGFNGGAAHFINPHYEDYATAADHKEGMIRVSGVVWFTNLETNRRHEILHLFKTYSPEEYPKYDNYDAIEVSKTALIPYDWEGAMGVPVTFLDKYNPEQFEIIGNFNANNETDDSYCYVKSEKTPVISNGKEMLWNGPVVNKKPLYKRIVIRNKNPGVLC